MKERRPIFKLSRISGIFSGIMLIYMLAIFTVTSVITTSEYWIAQNDRYDRRESLNLVSNDDYNALFHSYIAMFKGNDDPEDTDIYVTLKGDPDDYADTFAVMGNIQLNSVATPYTCTAKLNEKLKYTVEQLEKNGKEDAAPGMFYFQLALNYLTDNFEGVNINGISVTDQDGNALKATVVTASVTADNTVKLTKVTEESTVFAPKTAYTTLRVYVTPESDTSALTLSFNGDCSSNITGTLRFSFKEALTNEEVANLTGPEAKITTEGEQQQLIKAGKINNVLKILILPLFVIAVALCVLTVKKHGRSALFGIGVYVLITAVILCIAINLLAFNVPSEWGFEKVFDFTAGSTPGILLDNSFAVDYAHGCARFFDFTMLLPLGVGYVLIKASRSKKTDPNENYMYQ